MADVARPPVERGGDEGLSPPPLWALTAGAAALGAGLAWVQAPTSFWLIIFIVLPLAALLADAAHTAKRAALVGWAFGFGYFMPGLLWIGEAFFVEADRFAWLAPFAVTLLPAALAIYWGLAFGVARALGGSVWAMTGAWALAEYARAQMFTGFPWGMLGFAWVDTPVAQVAAWIGPFGLTALTMFAAFAIGRGLIGRDVFSGREPNDSPASPERIAWGVGGAALIIAAWIAGEARTPVGPPPRADVAVRLVQPNVPQTEKWSPEHLQRNFNRLMLLSASDPAATPPDLVVWPETAVTPDVMAIDENRQIVMARLQGSHAQGPRLVVGTQRAERAPDSDGLRFYNSLFTVETDGRVSALYDKHHLVPFGEFLPFQETLEAIGVYQLAGGRGGFSSGPGPQSIAVEGLPSFGALICYEAIFPDEMPTGEDRPDLLLQITNDAWFGDSSGPWQHFAQARMRAIEQGLPFLRSANTGVSAAIDPYGRIEAQLALNAPGNLDVRPSVSLPPTLYATHGETAFGGLLALFLGAGLANWRRAVAAS